MWDPSFQLTTNEILAFFFFFFVWPPLATMSVCGIAGWLLPRIHWLVGAGLGLLGGVANIFPSAYGVGWFIDLDIVDVSLDSPMGAWDVLGAQFFFILLGSSIPVAGMLWWSRRK